MKTIAENANDFESIRTMDKGNCSHEYGERKNEFNYQRPLCAVLAAHGFRYDPEVTQTMGRSDLVAEHPCGLLPA